MFKNSFIDAQVDNGGRRDIVQFIADIRFYDDYVGNELVRRLFRCGYCYYFAHMLKRAFKCGRVVCVKNRAHWLFEYADVFYDIEGVYEAAGGENIVPESCMSDKEIGQYLHVPSIPDDGSKDIPERSRTGTQGVVALQEFRQYIDNRFSRVV